jgi:hypothetical protein
MTVMVPWRTSAAHCRSPHTGSVNFAPNTWEIKLQPKLRYAVVLGLLPGAAILMMSNPSPFLCFQF